MIGSVPIVEEELLARGDEPFRVDTNAMIAIDHNHFGVAVRIDRMVRETDLVSTARRIDHVFFVEIEQKARAYRVVHATAQFAFVLRQLKRGIHFDRHQPFALTISPQYSAMNSLR